ncbi:MAG: PilW family protein [Thermodesulfobacteriota bacterium]|nr:PilW family protein [Thermodesulfobacteriota bacterium]
MNTRYYKSEKNGFTLVEIMVTLAISIIVIGAIYSVYTDHVKASAIQEQVVHMQQNVRFAMETISSDVRLAGYGIAKNEAFFIGNIDFDYDGSSDFSSNNEVTRMNADAIMIRRADTPPIKIVSYSGSSTVLRVCNPSPFAVWDILEITFEYSGGISYFVTIQATNIAVDSSNPCGTECASGQCDKIIFNAGQSDYNSPGGLNVEDKDWNKATIAVFTDIVYFLDPDGNGDGTADDPVLLQSINGAAGQILAEDIEDLQFCYGLDTTGDGLVDSWLDSPANVNQVRSVRVNILARTARQDSDFNKGQRPALEDHAAAAGTDGYRRRLLTSVIRVRNMGL